jgi:RNA polymerase sigma factor (TIGR02999 family)
MSEVTSLIAAARDGDKAAEARVFELLYADLKRIARRLAGYGADAPRATSLVHEAYLRIARPGGLPVNDRVHFFALAARAMRQLAVDRARERHAAKRGGGIAPMSLEELDVADGRALRDADLLSLDQALQRLRELDSELVQLVEMRFFGGLELEEIAELNGRSVSSLKRDWRKARAFLHDVLAPEGEA